MGLIQFCCRELISILDKILWLSWGKFIVYCGETVKRIESVFGMKPIKKDDYFVSNGGMNPPMKWVISPDVRCWT